MEIGFYGRHKMSYGDEYKPVRCTGCGNEYSIEEDMLSTDKHCQAYEYLLMKGVPEKDLATEQVTQAEEIGNMLHISDIGKLLTEIYYFEMWRREKEQIRQKSRITIGATSFHMGAAYALAHLLALEPKSGKAIRRLKKELEGMDEEEELQ